MSEQNKNDLNVGITVDEIMSMINEEVTRKKQAKISICSMVNRSVSAKQTSGLIKKSRIAVNPASIRVLIAAAESNADAGAEVSPMEQFNGITRILAKAVGKVIVILAKFITDKQRVFNANIINVLKSMTVSHESLSKNCAAEIDNMQAEFDSILKGMQQKFDAQLGELTRLVSENKLTILEQRRSLGIILEQTANLNSKEIQKEPLSTINAEAEHLFDDLYLVFENHFRGTREDVKNRLQAYLPYLERLQVPREAAMIDIGCGRGEWLELLKDKGYNVKGIDLNRSMVESCQTLGLDVINADGIAYLQGLETGSVSAVTGFHLLEHLPFDRLIALFDESLRVLAPGGMIVFETPNPENIGVGSCNFYFDPTHRNPLPPATISFIAEQRGYAAVEIKRLHEIKAPDYTGHEHVDELLCRFNCEQDYAVIAYKAL